MEYIKQWFNFVSMENPEQLLQYFGEISNNGYNSVSIIISKGNL